MRSGFRAFSRIKTIEKAHNSAMIKKSLDYGKAKSLIAALKASKVKVTQNLGRNKFVTYSGVVTGVYPALFTVSPDEPTNGKTSFSYSELLCGNVTVTAV